MQIELSPNKFIDNRDKLGLFKTKPEPFNFLSLENQSSIGSAATSGAAYPDSQILLPQVSLEILLSDQERTYERNSYSLMILLGDIGGFYGAVYGIFYWFISWYSYKMFEAAVSSEIPVKERREWSEESFKSPLQ